MSLFTKKAYVGLDIGHHTLRAVQVERTPTGWRVAKSASAPTPEDTVRDGVKVNPILLKEKAQTSSVLGGGPPSAGH